MFSAEKMRQAETTGTIAVTDTNPATLLLARVQWPSVPFEGD